MHAELAEVRTAIRRLTIDTSKLGFSSLPWETQRSTRNALTLCRTEEAKLVARIAADERRTADLVKAAESSGNPLLFAIVYVAAGVAAEAA